MSRSPSGQHNAMQRRVSETLSRKFLSVALTCWFSGDQSLRSGTNTAPLKLRGSDAQRTWSGLAPLETAFLATLKNLFSISFCVASAAGGRSSMVTQDAAAVLVLWKDGRWQSSENFVYAHPKHVNAKLLCCGKRDGQAIPPAVVTCRAVAICLGEHDPYHIYRGERPRWYSVLVLRTLAGAA